MRSLCSVLMVVALAVPVLAEDGPGWTFSGRFQGSSNSSGLVMKADPTLGYSFSKNFQTYIGLPVYFVKESSTTSTTSTTQTPNSFMNGLGNAYLGFHIGVDREAVNFGSNVEATAPTGDKDKGFSTGRATVDWTNSLSHSFSSVTPFANIGLANTVSDTSFFVRPFTSLGLVSHFDGGAKFSLSQFVDVGASAYGLRGAGQQRIISKLFKGQSTTSATPSSTGTAKNRVFDTSHETVGTADLTNDHGFSTWLTAHSGSKINFQAGYTRSAGYDLNTVFFGVGFRVGH
jgi:hypothetical protein